MTFSRKTLLSLLLISLLAHTSLQDPEGLALDLEPVFDESDVQKQTYADDGLTPTILNMDPVTAQNDQSRTLDAHSGILTNTDVPSNSASSLAQETANQSQENNQNSKLKDVKANDPATSMPTIGKINAGQGGALGLRSSHFKEQQNSEQIDFLQQHDRIKTTIGWVSLAHDEDQIPNGWRTATRDQIKQASLPVRDVIKRQQEKDVHSEERAAHKPEKGQKRKLSDPVIIIKEVVSQLNLGAIADQVKVELEEIDKELQKLKQIFKFAF